MVCFLIVQPFLDKLVRCREESPGQHGTCKGGQTTMELLASLYNMIKEAYVDKAMNHDMAD